MNKLTNATRRVYALTTAPHWAGGFRIPCSQGTEAMCRKVRGFFYASRISMAGGVLGSREAGRFLDPVCEPDTSSAAQGFASPVGGFKPQSRSLS